jgi:hypothetical protein
VAVAGAVVGTIEFARSGSAASTLRGTDRVLPVVEGPITGGSHGYPFAAYFGGVDRLGYVEQEFFLSGTATNYNVVGTLTHDGQWTIDPGSTADYKTRILVRYPKDASRFNGTVIVEWVNVSAGYEIAFADAPGVYEAGFAYVIVSAQRAGLFGNVFDTNPVGLTQWDPQRYGSLSITDDSFSYDIYTQAALALLGQTRPGGGEQPSLLGKLHARKVIGVGGSQSGSRVLAYTNGVQIRENVFDALMPIVCAGAASDFLPDAAQTAPGQSRTVFTQVRTDLTVPVFELNSETESLFYFATGSRQPDTPLFREWEVTGATHANVPLVTLLAVVAHRDGVGAWGPTKHASDVNWLPTLDAAYQHVQGWMDGGPPPPVFDKMEINATGKDYARDQYGNALGGIRLPEITVPVAAYSGALALGLGGSTTPLPDATLKTLYVAHGDYYEKVLAAAQDIEDQGAILPYRTTQYIGTALVAPIPPY